MDKSKVVHIGQADNQMQQLPTPPSYLTNAAKRHYKKIVLVFRKEKILKEKYFGIYEIMAESLAEFEFALRAIKEKNKQQFGAGYIQKFATGATNITTEMVVKKNAQETLFRCFKQMGLDPLSEKALAIDDTGQLDLFQEFNRVLKTK